MSHTKLVADIMRERLDPLADDGNLDKAVLRHTRTEHLRVWTLENNSEILAELSFRDPHRVRIEAGENAVSFDWFQDKTPQALAEMTLDDLSEITSYRPANIGALVHFDYMAAVKELGEWKRGVLMARPNLKNDKNSEFWSLYRALVDAASTGDHCRYRSVFHVAHDRIVSLGLESDIDILRFGASLDVRFLKLFRAVTAMAAKKPESSEFWAVFENWDAGGKNSDSVYDYDFKKSFRDERSAIDYEQQNPDYRIRKLVRMPE